MTADITWTPVTVRLSQLTPWERNPKRISKTHASRLLDLWQRLGQFQTIAIGPSGEVYDGHQRLSVLKAKHGAGYEVQALQSSRPLTEAEREELTVAAHVGTVGQFDWDALSGWDADNLQQWGFDNETLANWQADIVALSAMLASEEEPPPEDPGPQIDKAEELREKWGAETGQLWALGEHRLICGDCTDAAVVARVMGGERADMVFTDPPYGVEWSGKGGASIEGDITGTLIPLMFADLPNVIADRCWVYVCGGAMNMAAYGKMFDRFLRTMPRIIVWDKGSPAINHNGYHFSIELIYYGFTKGAGALWFGSRAGEAATDIWRVPRPSTSERLHLTEKPVELPERAIGNSCPTGGIVWEPFSGSGTTLIACERLGRRCRAVEISPGYVAVAIQRWVDMTGGEPVILEQTG